MSSGGRAMSLPIIQVLTPERLQQPLALPKEIADLLYQVQQLRNETDSLVCNCTSKNCPFVDTHISTFNTDSVEDLTVSPKSRRQGIVRTTPPAFLNDTPSLKGIERRSDGTIVERDGPTKISREDSLEQRLMRSSMNSTAASLGQHLSVLNTVVHHSESDCEVDSDNLFVTCSDDHPFTRRDPKRQKVRVTPKSQRRSTIPGSNTPPSHLHRRSLQNFSAPLKHQRYNFCLRSVASLPSCTSFSEESDFESLSTCSSSSVSSTILQLPTVLNRQHGGLIITP